MTVKPWSPTSLLNRTVGIDTYLVSLEEAATIGPMLDVNGVVAAAYEPRSGYADPYAVTTTYARAARELGATVQMQVEAVSLQMDERQGDRRRHRPRHRGNRHSGGSRWGHGHPSCWVRLGSTFPWSRCVIRSSRYRGRGTSCRTIPLWPTSLPRCPSGLMAASSLS